MNKSYSILGPATALGCLMFASSSLSAAVAGLDVNLVHNGDAEASIGKSGSGRNTIAGWNDPGAVYGDTTVTSGGTEANYSANTQTYAGSYSQAASQTYSGGDLLTFYGDVTAGNAIKGDGNLLGAKYLYGGNSTSATFTLTQTIDLSNALALLTAINGGYAQFTMEGWFGGYGPGSSSGDFGSFRAAFYTSTDGTGSALDTITVGPTGAISNTAMHFYSNTGLVPVGTQSVTFSTIFNRTYGGNDAALDNLAFVMTAIPEPSTYVLIGGAAALGLVALRRRRRI